MGLDKRLLAPTTLKWIRIGVATAVISLLLSMVLATIIGDVINGNIEGTNNFGDWLPWLIGLIVIKGILGWTNRHATYRASSETKVTVRDMIYEHALKLGPGVLGRRRTGDLVNTAVDGMEWLEQYFGVYYVQFLIGIFTPLLLCIYIFFIDWVVGLSLIISIPMTPVFLGLFARNFRGVSERYREMNNYLAAQFLDSLQGMTTLKLFNLGQARGDKIAHDVETNRVETMRLLLVNQVMIFFTDWGFAMGTTLAMTVVALLRLRAGFVTPGEVVALVLLSAEFARPLTLIGAFFFAGAIGREVAKKIGEFLDEEPSVPANDTQPAPDQWTPSLRFDNVRFAYKEGDAPALDGVTFDIESGEMVALVGQSGAGKTTITNLLLRLFIPQEGKIFMGKHNASQLPLDWVRDQIALVPQNPYLFYGSFAQNLRLAKETATHDELKSAATAANIHNFIIKTPDGYDTMIGERGMSISGGQAQRLAIARALLKGSPIVILDEPTSQIDVENEQIIQEAIDHLTADKTVILIAHRLSTVAQADRLIVMDKGKIMEVGTPAELEAQSGLYASMVATHNTVMEVATA